MQDNQAEDAPAESLEKVSSPYDNKKMFLLGKYQ